MNPKYVKLLPAIYRVNVPKRRVLENHIGYDNASGVHEFNKIWSSELERSLPPHVPPDITLAINRPILA